MAKTALVQTFHRRPSASALSHLPACARTFFGAVPPWLTRLLTDLSTESTAKTSLVIRLLDRLHGDQRQFVQRDFLGRRLGHDPSGNMMRFAERHLQRAHQPIGEIGRGRVAFAGGFAHALDVGRACPAPCRSWRRSTAAARRKRRSRLPCPPACPSDRRAEGPSSRSAAPSSAPMTRPGLGAHQLGGVRIALLRHDR